MKDASRYYLDELFAELVELPTEDREKALGGLTGDDPTLSRQLRALLAASEPPRPTLELREGLELDRYRLGERLAEALRDAADRLSVHDERIEHDAAIVHRHIVHDLQHAGLGIDLDFAGLRSI